MIDYFGQELGEPGNGTGPKATADMTAYNNFDYWSVASTTVSQQRPFATGQAYPCTGRSYARLITQRITPNMQREEAIRLPELFRLMYVKLRKFRDSTRNRHYAYRLMRRLQHGKYC